MKQEWTEARQALWGKMRLWCVLQDDFPECGLLCKSIGIMIRDKKNHRLACIHRYGKTRKPIGLYFYTWDDKDKNLRMISPNPPQEKVEYFEKKYVCNKFFNSPK